MPYPPPPRAPTYDYDRGGGQTMLDLIMAQGRIQAEGAERSGAIWGNALGNIGQTLAAGFQQYGAQRDERRVGEAIRAATSSQYPSATRPAAGTAEPDPGSNHINSILGNLPPELRPRVLKGIQEADEAASRVSTRRQTLEQLKGQVAKQEREAQQEAADYGATVAHNIQPFLSGADGGLGAIQMGLEHARARRMPGVERYEAAVQQAAETLQRAQASGDPGAIASAVHGIRQTFTPMLQQMAMGASPALAEKWQPKTREVTTRNADGSETTRIVADTVGQTFQSAAEQPKPAAVGSFEDYVVQRFGSRPSPDQIAQAKETYGRADDRPITINQPRPLSQTAEAGIIQRLTKQWDTTAAPVREINRQVGIMDAGLTAARRGDVNAGSQAVIQTFNKILDSLSVVREGEYARTAEGQSAINRIKGAIENLRVGGAKVPLSELETFATLARAMAEKQKAFLPAMRERIGRQAERYNIPQELIFEDTGGSPAPPAPDGGAPPVRPPTVGSVVRGYRYKGGDPASPSSWERQ